MPSDPASTPPADDQAPSRPGSHRPQALAVLQQFRMIFKSAKEHFSLVEDQTGVSGSQLWALTAVHSNPGLRVGDLARLMAIQLSSASNLVDKLERRGLLVKERSSTDQRVVHLSLSEYGKSLVLAAPQPASGILPDALDQLSDAELAQLEAMLTRVSKLLKFRNRSGKATPLADI